jgi:hypothetical protein
MRFFLACLMALACISAEAAGPTVIVTAQDHATVIARRGVLVHSGCGQYEGIGCGSTPESARRNCCFFGKRVIVEEGVAYSPARRQWFAVIRYR